MGLQMSIMMMMIYVLAVITGIVFMVCLIVFLFRYLSLKGESNRLLRELIQVLKENKQGKE